MPVYAGLFGRPQLTHDICASEGMYRAQLKRAARGWVWHAATDNSYASMLAAAQQQLGADGYSWSRQSMLAVLMLWLLVGLIAYLGFLLSTLAPTQDWLPRVGLTVLFILYVYALLYLLGLFYLWLAMRITARHMVATALLRDMAARMASPIAPCSSHGQPDAPEAIAKYHALLAYLEAAQEQFRYLVFVHAALLLRPSYAQGLPRQTLRASAGLPPWEQHTNAVKAADNQPCSGAFEPTLAGVQDSDTPDTFCSSWAKARALSVPLSGVEDLCTGAALRASRVYNFNDRAAHAGAARARDHIVSARSTNQWLTALVSMAVVTSYIFGKTVYDTSRGWLIAWPEMLVMAWLAYLLLASVVFRVCSGTGQTYVRNVASQARRHIRWGVQSGSEVDTAIDLAAAACGLVQSRLPVVMIDESLDLRWTLSGHEV